MAFSNYSPVPVLSLAVPVGTLVVPFLSLVVPVMSPDDPVISLAAPLLSSVIVKQEKSVGALCSLSLTVVETRAGIKGGLVLIKMAAMN